MAMRGERFELNLDPEDAYLGTQEDAHADDAPKAPLAFDFIKDVLEREPASPRPPEPPKFTQTTSGFPAHRKRDGKSRFKRQLAAASATASGTSTNPVASESASASSSRYLNGIADASADEKKSIDQQTTQMIQSMSPQELAEAREELMSESSVSIIQRLLKRSTVNESGTRSNSRASEPVQPSKGEDAVTENKPNPVLAGPKKTVSFAESAEPLKGKKSDDTKFDEDAAPRTAPADLQSAASEPTFDDAAGLLAPGQGRSRSTASSHTSNPPTLDPSSDSFLSDLHSTYFPDLPSDPNQLAWMAPLPKDGQSATPSDANGTHIPGQAADLRFDFHGRIVTRAQSESIPVTKGLHHHGKDPGSAGYTINELSIYSRSTVAAQRCFAYQLLGRVMYRLGKGEFGDEDSEQAKELYDEIKRGWILEQLLQEAARDSGTGSESARVWALEAVWLWRKGGGKGLDDVGAHEEDVMGDAAGSILEEGLNTV